MTSSTPPSSSSTWTGLSLWLVPTNHTERDVVVREMTALRQRCLAQGEHDISAPCPPHVTLLPGIKIAAHNAEGDEDVFRNVGHVWQTMHTALDAWKRQGHDQRLRVGLDDVVTRGLYFQCILLAVEQTTPLMSLNAAMRTAFRQDRPDAPPYFPHGSLLYGSYSVDEAQAVIQQLAQDGIFRPARKSNDTSATDQKGVVFGQDASTSISSLQLGAIELWNTNGKVDDWHMLQRTSLG